MRDGKMVIAQRTAIEHPYVMAFINSYNKVFVHDPCADVFVASQS